MRLVILGGAGFRTPLVYGALLGRQRGVTEVVLYDVDEGHLRTMGQILGQTAATQSWAPSVSVTTNLDEALDDADIVFSAIRVGGLAGRVVDERVALELGLLGQETTGPGGIAYGLRTLPVAVHIAARVRTLAPHAWVINFTNPAGMVTEAMATILGDRVVGICDTPITMAKRAIRLLGLDPAMADRGEVALDYVGLNHLGWLRGLRHDGVDLLPRLLADDRLLSATEEGALFGLDWVRSLGALPNEYLYYYTFARESLAAIRRAGQTRGEFLLAQQDSFWSAARAEPSRAHDVWTRTRAEREETYMSAEHGGAPRGGETGVADVGGYEGVALAFMEAVRPDGGGRPASMVLNVRNGGAVPGLPDDAVVEVPVTVTVDGPKPLRQNAPDLTQLGLMQQVKGVERLTIEAASGGSRELARRAFAAHPLVDSAEVATRLVQGYCARNPLVAAALPHP